MLSLLRKFGTAQILLYNMKDNTLVIKCPVSKDFFQTSTY